MVSIKIEIPQSFLIVDTYSCNFARSEINGPNENTYVVISNNNYNIFLIATYIGSHMVYIEMVYSVLGKYILDFLCLFFFLRIWWYIFSVLLINVNTKTSTR